jgi:hypothetical protein
MIKDMKADPASPQSCCMQDFLPLACNFTRLIIVIASAETLLYLLSNQL